MEFHVVIVPFPAQGHILPLIHLSKKLAAVQGTLVTIVNIDSIHDNIQATWICPPELHIQLLSLPLELNLPMGFDSKSNVMPALIVDALHELQQPMVKLIDQLNQKGPTVSCIISDYYFDSVPHAAAEVGIPSICYWPGAASWAAIEYHLPCLILEGVVPIIQGDNQVLNIPGLHPLAAKDMPLYLHERDFKKIGKERMFRRSKRIPVDPWVLVNSIYELEPEVFDELREKLKPAQVISIGPLFPVNSSESTSAGSLRLENKQCIEWLDQQSPRSVLYISFGSIAVLSSVQFEELARGLESSNQPFLWVIREELVPEGIPEEFYRGFTNRVNDRAFFVPWAPQLQVLSHFSVGGFLTHCGWNSMLESMCNGVPMLGWPHASDQNTNEKIIMEAKGLGINLWKGVDVLVTKEEVKRAVQILFEEKQGQEIRIRARELSDSCKKAANEGGSSCNNIQAFISKIKAVCNCC